MTEIGDLDNLKNMRHLSDEQVFALASQEIDPELRARIEDLMQDEAEGIELLDDEIAELADLKARRDDFLRTQTRARLEAGMRGLTLPDQD